MKPGDLVLTRGARLVGNHFIPYGTPCLVLGPAPQNSPEEGEGAMVMVRTAGDVVIGMSKRNLRSAYETR